MITEGPIRPNAFARELVRRFFPDYRGRKYRVRFWRGPRVLHTWWDGGSKDEYALIDPRTRTAQTCHTYHPGFEGGHWRDIPKFDMPPQTLLIERSWFCGKNAGITFYVRPEDVPCTPMLTEGGDHAAVTT